MGFFDSLPIRENGQTVDASWWNSIRTALIVAFVDTNPELQVTILDNQAAYVALTGFDIDAVDFIYAEWVYSILRTSSIGPTERRETGRISVQFNPTTSLWELADRKGSTDALNIADSLTITTVGTVGTLKYKSDSMGGTYVGKWRGRLISTILLET